MACNIDMLSENITKLFLEETFTYVKALLIASTSAVTNTATNDGLLLICAFVGLGDLRHWILVKIVHIL